MKRFLITTAKFAAWLMVATLLAVFSVFLGKAGVKYEDVAMTVCAFATAFGALVALMCAACTAWGINDQI